MKVFPLVLTVALTACAAPQKLYWDKPGGNTQEFTKDKYECERDLRQSGHFGTGGGIIGEIQRQDAMKEFFHHCMNARGYTARYVPA